MKSKKCHIKYEGWIDKKWSRPTKSGSFLLEGFWKFASFHKEHNMTYLELTLKGILRFENNVLQTKDKYLQLRILCNAV